MNVLGIGCHPDDLEISAYGTLAKYAKLGHNVSVCHVANGNLGHVEIMPDELREIRFNEAEAASKIIGAKHYSIDIDDLYVTAENDELIRKLAHVVRITKPDIIITHNPVDYMNDHMQTFYAALRASFAASIPHYDLEADEPAVNVCPIYHMNTSAGIDFVPTEYVDITDTIELKLRALACHASQVKWLKDHDGIDVLEKTRIMAASMGYQCGALYAEGFRICKMDLRTTTKRLLP